MPYNPRLVKSLREKYKAYQPGDEILHKPTDFQGTVHSDRQQSHSGVNPATGKPKRTLFIESPYDYSRLLIASEGDVRTLTAEDMDLKLDETINAPEKVLRAKYNPRLIKSLREKYKAASQRYQVLSGYRHPSGARRDPDLVVDSLRDVGGGGDMLETGSSHTARAHAEMLNRHQDREDELDRLEEEKSLKSLREKYKASPHYAVGDRVRTVGPRAGLEGNITNFRDSVHWENGKPHTTYHINQPEHEASYLEGELEFVDPNQEERLAEEKALYQGERAMFVPDVPDSVDKPEVGTITHVAPGDHFVVRTQQGLVPAYGHELSKIDPKTGENLNLKALRAKYKTRSPSSQDWYKPPKFKERDAVQYTEQLHEDLPGDTSTGTISSGPHNVSNRGRGKFNLYTVSRDDGGYTSRAEHELRPGEKAWQPGQRIRHRTYGRGTIVGGAITENPTLAAASDNVPGNPMKGKAPRYYTVQFDNAPEAAAVNNEVYAAHMEEE